MARYNDGRTALSHDLTIEARADGLALPNEIWPWAAIKRCDDGGAEFILRREPDTGERLTLTALEAQAAEAAASSLFSRKALNRADNPLLIGSLAAAAASLAALFLIGVPLAAEPIAQIVPARYQTHLADLAWDQVNALSEGCEGAHSTEPSWDALSSMFNRLKANAPGAPNSNIFVVDAPFPNAFTLPGGDIVLTDDLIRLAESPDEIAGVIAHELGHVEARHVMKNVVRQMGLGLFIDIVFGGAGAGQTVAAVNLLALRYSREDEIEADGVALRIMDQAGLNPAAAGALFRRLAEHEGGGGFSIPELLSSHPDTLRRAEEAERHALPGRAPVLNAEEWQAVRAMCGSAEGGAPTPTLSDFILKRGEEPPPQKP